MEIVILEEENPGDNSCNELPSSDLEYIDEVHTVVVGRKKTIHQRATKKKLKKHGY